MNGDRNPVLMVVAGASTANLEPSVASTARALVLYETAFLSLPKAAYAAATEQLESNVRLPDLEYALADSLRSDPSTPLDADAHPEIYEFAARIAVDLLSGIIDVGGETVARQATPRLLAAVGDFALGPAVPAAGLRTASWPCGPGVVGCSQGGEHVRFPSRDLGSPEQLQRPVELVIHFGDGRREEVQPNFENGTAVVAFKHSYDGEVPSKMRVVLQNLADKPALLFSREAALPVENAANPLDAS